MTMKTKRTLAIGGGTVMCAALTILIAAQFKPAPEAVTASVPEVNSTPSISVEISTATLEEIDPVEIPKAEIIPATEPDNGEQNDAPVDIDPEKEAADFIGDGGIEIEQNFPEPEIETQENEPPAPPEPPKIEDEEMLTNPDTEPVYEPAQTTVTQPEKSDNPNIDPAMHGQKKDGMIFINGFGWIKDEGGGGIAEHDSEMYENGNKIGYFG